jgi:hypothetical protein
VEGVIEITSYETQDGETRLGITVHCNDVAASLGRAVAPVARQAAEPEGSTSLYGNRHSPPTAVPRVFEDSPLEEEPF